MPSPESPQCWQRPGAPETGANIAQGWPRGLSSPRGRVPVHTAGDDSGTARMCTWPAGRPRSSSPRSGLHRCCWLQQSWMSPRGTTRGQRAKGRLCDRCQQPAGGRSFKLPGAGGQIPR